jgi:hypothetical protein
MIETPASGSINRIIIAVDAMYQSINVLELAAKLASHKKIEMSVLFIEDVNLINYASLPIAREIDLVTAIDRQLDDLQLVRVLQTQAQKTSRFLEQLASQFKINYSFKVLRGHYINEVLSASLETDVLFLSKQIGMYEKPRLVRSRRVVQSVTLAPSASTLCVIFDGSPGSGRALILARELAFATGKELVVLLHISGDESIGRLRKLVASITETENGQIHYMVVSDEDNSSLSRILRRNKCELLVLYKSGREQLTGSFLEKPGCPVVVVQ